MSYLVDTNVLLRSVQSSHPMHSDASAALRVLSKRKERLCVIPQNIIEFWAVATRPTANNGLGLSIVQAVQEVAKIKRLFECLPDTVGIFTEWEKLVVQHQVVGKSTHDTRLVAAMVAHGLTNILTFNTGDFARFVTIITAVDPAQL